jgi:NADPH-ferrihemoprotein reductase
MANKTHHLLDTLDIIFLGTIGLGTIAWFARHQIADKLLGKSTKTELKPANDVKTGPPKKERNFVKVMQQQVKKIKLMSSCKITHLFSFYKK